MTTAQIEINVLDEAMREIAKRAVIAEEGTGVQRTFTWSDACQVIYDMCERRKSVYK